jgi:hypothetical protein
MVRPHCDFVRCSNEDVSPVAQRLDYRKELSIPDVIVALCGVQRLREVANIMLPPLVISLEQDSCYGYGLMLCLLTYLLTSSKGAPDWTGISPYLIFTL